MIIGYSLQDRVIHFLKEKLKDSKYKIIRAIMIIEANDFDMWYLLKRDNISNVQKAIDLHFELTEKFQSSGFDIMTQDYEGFDFTQYPDTIIIKSEIKN